ncbi:TPA: ankyrin repeat domain-containing protein, partial [Klebsiella pneumoniae]
DGPSDAPLRQAILDHRPMADIRAADRSRTGAPDADLLNLAVKYPKALRYLLDRGANPNTANSFGKTPLMYAAQYNQIQSAKLLLRAGADINAKTVVPPNDCSVSLHTINVTALHYAVRYSSAPLIKLLLANGAAAFKAQPNGYTNVQPLGTPLDWLYHYSQPGKRGNPRISPHDVPELAKALGSTR